MSLDKSRNDSSHLYSIKDISLDEVNIMAPVSGSTQLKNVKNSLSLPIVKMIKWLLNKKLRSQRLNPL